MDNERIEIQNAKVVGLQENSHSKKPELVFSIEDVLSPGSALERTITLWVTEKKDGPISEKAIESTQRALRKALNDETVEFHWPLETENENDLSNWVERNKGAELHGITQRGNFYSLPSGSNGSLFGAAKRRVTIKPEDNVEYNPSEHRVLVINAMDEEQKTAFMKNQSHPNIKPNRKGQNQAYLNDQIIEEVSFATANKYNTSHDATTRLEFLDEIIPYFEIVKKAQPGKLTVDDVKTFRDNVESDPNKHGYREMIELFGGSNLPKLPKEVAGAATTLMAEGTRIVLSIQILNPKTGYIYKISDMKPLGDMTSFTPNFLEFFAGDPSYVDVTKFVSEMNLPDYQKAASNAVAKVLDGNVENLTNSEFGNPADTILNFLRELLVGRTVAVRVPAPSQNDFEKLGSYLQSIGLQSQSNFDKIAGLGSTVATVTATESVVFDEESLPFPTKAPQAEDVEDVEVKEDESKEESTSESKNEDVVTEESKEEKVKDSPFNIDEKEASNLFSNNNPFDI